MSVSDDSYNYESYDIAFYEYNEGPPLIKKRSRLIAAVVQNDVETLKSILDSPKWYNVKDKYGYNLLQIAILRENKEVFDFLLSLENYPLEELNHKGETPLVVSLTGFISDDDVVFMGDHFSYELIKKGVHIHSKCYKNNTLLHFAIYRGFYEVAKLLIENGIDVNAQNDDGETAFHMLYINSKSTEITCMMLCCGADPLICNFKGYTAFEVNVVDSLDNSVVLENLFYYTFDQYTQCKIHVRILFEIVRTKSPFFNQIIDSITEFIVDDNFLIEFTSLFSMELENLKPLLDKFDFVIREMFMYYTDNVIYNVSESILYNLDILLESSLRAEVTDFIRNIDSTKQITRLDEFQVSEKTTTELICFFLSYGMDVYENDLQLIYKQYGYCELFKVLLHMDLKKSSGNKLEMHIIPTLIYQVDLDIENCLNEHEYSSSSFKELLHYSALPVIHNFFNKSKDRPTKLERLPQIPLLVELARNATRSFLVKKFQITSAKQFYSLLHILPISNVHKKIISFETKLYEL